jgi:hypothetical protein
LEARVGRTFVGGAVRASAGGVWEVDCAGIGGGTTWRAPFELAASTQLRDVVALVNVTASRSVALGLSIVARDQSPRSEAATHGSLSAGEQEVLCVRRSIDANCRAVDIVLDLPAAEDLQVAVDMLCLVVLDDPMHAASAQPVGLVEANRLHRAGEHARALRAYVALHERHRHPLYVGNALICARRLAVSESN